MGHHGTTHGAQNPRAERRLLTVMFCDLVDSTEMSAQLDPEDMRDYLLRYRDICANAVKDHGGFVAQYLGDGILAYFGYPQAHESDVGNCLRAGQGIIRKLVELKSPPAQVRVGIATGMVVVGDVIAQHTQERDIAIGPTPNLAARLMKLGDPGEVILSGATKDLAPDLFEYKELPNKNLKGFDGSTTAWRLLGNAPVRTPSQAVHTRAHRIPFVGRDDEMTELARLWSEACSGAGQAVLITGEAGIGKSRLAHDFCAGIATGTEAPALVKLYCSNIGRNSPLRPVADDILTGAEVVSQMSEAEQAQRIGIYLSQTMTAKKPEVLDLCDFLSLTAGFSNTVTGDGEDRKAQVFDLLERYLCSRTPNKPSVLVVEDLHWSDSTTLELLEYLLLERIPKLPILVLLTARPEFLPSWPNGTHTSTIEVGRLSNAEASAFLDRMEAAETLPEETRRQVIERSDAIPLYLEEVCKATRENLAHKDQANEQDPSGIRTQAVSGVPTSLASSLMARLDRLGEVKEIAQVASVIGPVFPATALSHLLSISVDELVPSLEQLNQAEIILPRQKTAEPSYVFKHALTHEAAYYSVLKRERKRLHVQLAMMLEQEAFGGPDSQPELIARHYARGGRLRDAIEKWRQAGELARKRSANSDAIAHYTNGLELLGELPREEITDEIEIDLRTKLALALTAIHGAGSKEVGLNYAKARSLSGYKVDSEDHFPVMVGVWSNSFMGGDLKGAHSATEEILRIADRKNDATYAVEANRARGMTLFYRGDFSGAQDHISQTLALHDPEFHHHHALRFGLDPLVCCHAYLSYAQLFLGQKKAAIETSQLAIEEAKRTGHLYSEAFAMAFAALVRVNLEMPKEAAQLAQETIDCARNSEIEFFAKQQLVVKAWANAMKNPDAIDDMTTKVNAFLASHSSIGATRVMCMMAEMNLRHGREADAQAMLSRALKRANEKGELYYLSEIHRLQAELAWATQGSAGIGVVTTQLSRAIDIAEQQHAAIWIRRNAQCAQRLYRLMMKDTSLGNEQSLRLDSFTHDDVELAARISFVRKIIHRMSVQK